MIHHHDDTVTVHHGNCLEVLRALPDNSVDAVVTDPPYGIRAHPRKTIEQVLTRWLAGDRDYMPEGTGFMGRSWDRFVPPPAAWDQCFRVLKPGGHLLAFSGSRTYDLMCISIRLAGLDADLSPEIRDGIAWLYGMGMPKGLNVSKAIDEAAGAERQVVGTRRMIDTSKSTLGFVGADYGGTQVYREVEETAPATPEAEQWEGWNTALKPAFEPIVVARKPLIGTVVENILEHGVGAYNVDGCRIGEEERESTRSNGVKISDNDSMAGGNYGRVPGPVVAGRWPANVVLDASQAAELDEQSGDLIGHPPKISDPDATSGWEGWGGLGKPGRLHPGYDDTGGASKFFFVPEADPEPPAAGRWPANVALDESQAAALDEQSGESPAKPERTGPRGGSSWQGVGTLGSPEQEGTWPADPGGGASRFFFTAKAAQSERIRVGGVAHPTVKPLALMRWLVRLVTPPGGTVLEPFAGSGTTVEAAMLEGFRCIAVEQAADYLPLIDQRIKRAKQPMVARKPTRPTRDIAAQESFLEDLGA